MKLFADSAVTVGAYRAAPGSSAVVITAVVVLTLLISQTPTS